MKIRAEMGRQREPLLPQEYQVDKVVELPNTLFGGFLVWPLERYEFIRENMIDAYQDDGSIHCLLALCDESPDGILIQCGEDGQAVRAAYVAGARDVVQAKMDRIADHIIRQGTECTASGDWYIYSMDLEELFAVTVCEGNGFDSMIRETLERRPEVAGTEINRECIRTTFHPEFCAELRGRGSE